MATSDTNLPQLIIHELTKEEYEALTPEPNQLYLTPDESLTAGDLKTINGNSIVGSGDIGVGTVTSVNNVSPVNGNVTLLIPSTDNLANKDLSNLSSTGNAKFQAPLVSGTNIKTINSTSILGSGNISALQNTATGNWSLAIEGSTSSASNATSVGYSSTATGIYSSALGHNANATATRSTSVGDSSTASGLSSSAFGETSEAKGNYSVAIGSLAKTTDTATNSIQIGNGTNSVEKTLSVGFSGYNYQLLDGTTGLIPDDRLNTTIARTSAIPTESTVSSWGFTKNTGTVTSVNNVSPVNGNVTLNIPAAQVNSDWNATSGKAEILNKPNLATVATSGSYNDLTNKPTIPTVNDATLTIQQNGTDVQIFSANASSNVTANITVPTSISDLTDDTSTTPIDKADTLTGLTASVAELNYVDGVTSNIQTQIDGKVSKSGDTMTGALTIEAAGSATDATQNNCRVYLKNSLMDVNATPSENLVSVFTFTDKNGNQTGACYTRQKTNGVSDTRLAVNKNNKSAILAVGLNANDIAYCTFPNSICVDGQWVLVTENMLTNGTISPDTNYTYTLSFLPNDGSIYEVIGYIAGRTLTTSGKYFAFYGYSSLMANSLLKAITRTSAYDAAMGSFNFIIGSDRKFWFKDTGSGATGVTLGFRAYRRIGTNA